MHYHLEVILPPTGDVKKAIEEIMHPFSEHLDSDDEDRKGEGWWDWYQIGGRWGGAKLRALVGEDRIQAFSDKLNEMRVTVSCLQAGKQELMPASQIPMVDKLWRQDFPEIGGPCLLFAHSNDNSHPMAQDICLVKDIPEGLLAERVIIAEPHWNQSEKPGQLEAGFMLCTRMWNGCNFQDTTWNGSVHEAIALRIENLSNYKTEYAEKVRPGDDWLCVTVDYHS